MNATHLFVTPTLTSIFSVLGLSGLILLSFNFAIITQSGIIGDLLLGESRSTGLLDIAQNTVFEVSALTLENSVLNNISFFMFWILVGLVVFVSLSTLGNTIASITRVIETTHYLNQRKEHLDNSTYFRVVIRLIGGLGFFVFYIVFAKFNLPFAVLANQAWLGDIRSPIGWLYGFLGFIVLALSLHIFIVFVRLALLKPRLYGGWEALN